MDVHTAARIHHALQLPAGTHRLQFLQRLRLLKPFQNLQFLPCGRHSHRKPHKETVHLCLRQRERAQRLHRVFRRRHKERALQRICHAVYRDLMLLHTFQKTRLRTRRGAVDLIRQQHITEGGSFLENELSLLLVVIRQPGHIRGQQIRRELNTAELSVN